MLYAFVYDSAQDSIQKARELASRLLKQSPEALTFSMDANEFISASLDELLFSSALFKSQYIVILKSLSLDKEAFERFVKHADAFKESKHVFLFADSCAAKLDKVKGKFDKISENCNSYLPASATNDSKKTFALTDAILNSNTKEAWRIYAELVDESVDFDKLYGAISWTLKNLLIVKDNPEHTSTLKPFVYKKHKRALSLIDKDKLQSAYSDFLKLRNRAFKRNIPPELALEKWILTLKIKK